MEAKRGGSEFKVPDFPINNKSWVSDPLEGKTKSTNLFKEYAICDLTLYKTGK